MRKQSPRDIMITKIYNLVHGAGKGGGWISNWIYEETGNSGGLRRVTDTELEHIYNKLHKELQGE